MLIAGDIGGTKTRLALVSPEAWSAQAPRRTGVSQRRFPGPAADRRDVPGDGGRHATRRLLRRRRAGHRRPRASDQPAVGARGSAPCASALGLQRVSLLNDLTAVAHAVPHLQPEETPSINAGTADRTGRLGGGAGHRTWRSVPDLGARATSPARRKAATPISRRQTRSRRELWAFLMDRFGHVAYERVCSGSGLPNVYDFRALARSAWKPAFAATLESRGGPHAGRSSMPR